MGGVLFSPPVFIFENLTKSCVKLSTLESCEDQDQPVNELDGSEEEEVVTVVLEDVREKWDCESICSKCFSVHFTAVKYISILKKYVCCGNNWGKEIFLSYKQYKNICKRDSSIHLNCESTKPGNIVGTRQCFAELEVYLVIHDFFFFRYIFKFV